ncbi:MAG TPA: DUF664 domain-containing protein [Acidimicrobiia bacterium]|nr:DUF664 domain-containing protein [Acidimicrobiia bacterium]
MITTEDLLFFLDEVLDAMVRVVETLGDELACRRPEIDSINSPYVTLAHCIGVMDYWGGQVIAGRETDRDRDAEFRASGAVPDLVARARDARRQLARDLESMSPYEAPRGVVSDTDACLPLGSSQGGALVHIYSELAIHRGHMEICRDILLSRVVATVTDPAVHQSDSRYSVE